MVLRNYKLSRDGDDIYPSHIYIPVTKHELATFALVCRSWAKLCQKKIFKSVVLRSREDLFELLSLAGRHGSCIDRYIRRLVLEPRADSPPWIHLVCSYAGANPERLPYLQVASSTRLTKLRSTSLLVPSVRLRRRVHGSQRFRVTGAWTIPVLATGWEGRARYRARVRDGMTMGDGSGP